MKIALAVGVWAFVVATSVIEVLLFYSGPGRYAVDLYIGILAVVNAAMAGIFTMGLRDEPPVIHYLFLAPVFLVAVLILTMALAYPPAWVS